MADWRITEPRFRNPILNPSKSRLYILTYAEFDVLDSVLIMGGRAKLGDINTALTRMYDSVDIRTNLDRMVRLECLKEKNRLDQYDRSHYKEYWITPGGRVAFDVSINAAIATMIKRGNGGIRTKR